MKSMILKKLIFLLVFLSGSMLYSQITVSGTISDAGGAIPGVNVIVKGTSNGAVSDFDGKYSLDNVAEDATLVFSFVGFKTKEVAVNGQSTVNVTLEEDAAELEQVVVIGYGTTTVKDATGSVAAVTSEDFNSGVIASPEQLIQGKVAGVNISATSGAPGAGISLNIRGSNSIRSNNSPLYVVDGIPLSGEGNLAGTDGQDGGGNAGSSSNPLNFLNPNDIESISVLKDASATAIYGSRGANGVVIITTKTGKAGQGGVFDFSSNVSVSRLRNGYDLLDREAFLDAIETTSGATARAAADFGTNTDWQDVITRTVASQNQNLSYSNNYGDGNVYRKN